MAVGRNPRRHGVVIPGYRLGSIFSGIGGLEHGLELAGLGPVVYQVEIDDFCRSVLKRQWPGVKRFRDVRRIKPHRLPAVDVLAGGFPCQDISSAGKGAGLAGSSSGLWSQFARIISATRPRWVVVENVASGSQHWHDQVCSWLAKQGYETLSVPLSGGDVGAPHLRPRIFIVARDAHQKCQPMGAFNAKVAWLPEPSGPISPWPECPSLSVADGFPEQLAAYGNAVMPAHGEVVGWIIRELEGF